MCRCTSMCLCFFFRELRLQARVLVHLSLFVLFEMRRQARVLDTPQSVCVVSRSWDVRHVCWYTSVCLCCFRELRRQTRVLVHLRLFVLFQGVETPGTCVGKPQSVCVVSRSLYVTHVCWYTSDCLCCFRELRLQARVLVHLSLFVLFQGVYTSCTCVGIPQSVCVVSGSWDARHVCWYTSVCLCCFRELRLQARVLGTPQSVVLFQGV